MFRIPSPARTRTCRGLLLLFALFSFTTPLWIAADARAEHPKGPELLPERTLAFVQIADVPQFVAKYQESSLGRIGSDERILPLIRDLYGSATEAYADVEDRIGVSLDELLRIPQGELCLAVVAPETGRPQLVALIDVGDQLAAARQMLDRLGAQITERGGGKTIEDVGGVQLSVYQFGGDARRLAIFEKDATVVLTTDAALAKQLLDAWEGADQFVTLADKPSFRTVQQRSWKMDDPSTAQLVWYVEPFTLAQRLTRGNFSAQASIATLAALGVDGIEAAGGAFTLGTEKFDAVTQVQILIDTPRQGVLDAIALDEGDTTPEPWVPADVVSYTTVNWDVGKTLAEGERLFDMLRGEGAWQFDVIDRLSEQLDVDAQTQLLDQIAGRGTLVQWIERPARLNSEANLIGIKLRDTDAFRRTVEHIAARFPDRVTEDRYAGTTFYHVASRPPNRGSQQDERIARIPDPCFAILGDHLLAADSSKLLKEAIVTKQQSGASLADDIEFKLIASEIRRQTQGAKAGMISFSRPEESFRAMYEMGTSRDIRERLAANAQNNRAFKALYDALERNPLPPFSVIARHLAPGGALLTSDSTGFHYTSFTLRRDAE